MPSLHRNARLSTERPRQWPLAVGAISMAVLCVAVVALHASAPAPTAPPLPAPAPAPAPAPEPALAPAPAVEAPPPRAVAGTCHLDVLPPSMIQPLAPADAAALVAVVNDWVDTPDARPRDVGIDRRRGVAYVESEEDRGDDGPYPRSAGPESSRVCGSPAGWLRTHLRDRLRHVELRCQDNVCCYDGMEYSPVGYVVFRRSDVAHGPDWVLDGWAQVYSAALSPPIAEANWRHARTSLRRLATVGCPGESPGED